VHGIPNVNLYAKLEMMNPFGSVKDRVAWAMLKDELDDLITNDKMIVENSSGNTSKALQAIAGIYGVHFKLMSALAKIPEPLEVMQIQGAEIEEISQAGTDCFDPNDPNDPQYVIERFVQQAGGSVYFPSQFTNEKNVEVHRETTGQEILKDLSRVDWFFGGLGTTGSSRGIIEAIRTRDTDAKCMAVCATDNTLLPGVRTTGQLWEVGLFHRDLYSDIMGVSPQDSVDAMIELNRKSGLLCGPSAGGQYAAIKKYFAEHPASNETNVVFLACDRMEWYISYIKKFRPDIFGLTDTKSVMAYVISNERANQCCVAPENITPWIEQQKPLIIDMRTPASLKILSFDGAMNIPETTLENMIEKNQPFPKDKKVLFICAVGQKSLKVAAYLREKGVESYSLEGGVVAYQQIQRAAA
jgi:cysteine synthase B